MNDADPYEDPYANNTTQIPLLILVVVVVVLSLCGKEKYLRLNRLLIKLFF
jgi:hypothetical protein